MSVADPPLLVELTGRGEATIDEVLRARVAATPNARFLSWEEAVWTYEEGYGEAASFAAWVGETVGGPAQERRVASFLPNRPEAIWAWFGSLLCGSIYTALNRSHRGEILRDMIARSRAQVLVSDLDGLDLLPDLSGTGVESIVVVGTDAAPSTVQGVACLCWRQARPAVASRPETPRWRPVDPAQIVFTSGSTGRSKAVLISHTQMVRGAAWVGDAIEASADDVVHTWLPLFHIGGQLDAVLMAVLAGAEVALFPTFSRSRFWQQIDSSGSTVFLAFENLLRLLISLPPGPGESDRAVRVGITGGVPTDVRGPFEERFGVRLAESYGMTEAEPIAMQYADCPPDSVGRPTPDFEVAILDEDDLPLAEGKRGEIAVRPRRPHVMFGGYEDDPDATLASLRSLWYHTGDLGSVDAGGNLYFHGRIKHMIRRRGENISTWELESVLAQHPEVEECVAVGVPSELGEDDVKVIVVPRAGAGLDPVDLHSWGGERLAKFMVPRYVEVVEAIPRFDTGKVDVAAARKPSPGMWDAEAPTGPK